METVLLPFQFPFMQNAFIVAFIIALPTALLSCFLVLKGWSLMGDAISHAVLPGIVVAYIFNLPLIIGAFAAGMICALLTGFIADNSRVKQDTVMGVVFSGMFGIGIVIYTKVQTDVHLDHILFGNMLGVGTADLWSAGLAAMIVVISLTLRWRDFLAHALDAAHARAVGLNVNMLHYGLLALISLTVVATLKAVGIILAIALLISPGAIAFLLVRRFEQMLVTALIVNLIANLGGVYASFWLDSAPAPTIVMILTLIFIAALIWNIATTRARQSVVHPE